MTNLFSPDGISRRKFLQTLLYGTAGLVSGCVPKPDTSTPHSTPVIKSPEPTASATPTLVIPRVATPQPPIFTTAEPDYAATTVAKAQAQIGETATAMAPETALEVLLKNHAPPEVAARSVSLHLSNTQRVGSFQSSGFILETLEIDNFNFALIMTAGHDFVDEKNHQDLVFNRIRVFQPQFNNLELESNPQSPLTASDSTFFDNQPDCGLVLVQVPKSVHFDRLTPASTPLSEYTGKLFGLSFPSSEPPNFAGEQIPYIVSPDQIEDITPTSIRLTPSCSPGGSGTVLVNDHAELEAIVISIPYDAQYTTCVPIPADFATRRQRIYDKLHQIIATTA